MFEKGLLQIHRWPCKRKEKVHVWQEMGYQGIIKLWCRKYKVGVNLTIWLSHWWLVQELLSSIMCPVYLSSQYVYGGGKRQRATRHSFAERNRKYFYINISGIAHLWERQYSWQTKDIFNLYQWKDCSHLGVSYIQPRSQFLSPFLKIASPHVML